MVWSEAALSPSIQRGLALFQGEMRQKLEQWLTLPGVPPHAKLCVMRLIHTPNHPLEGPLSFFLLFVRSFIFLHHNGHSKRGKVSVSAQQRIGLKPRAPTAKEETSCVQCAVNGEICTQCPAEFRLKKKPRRFKFFCCSALWKTFKLH